MQQHVYAIAAICAQAKVKDVIVCPGSRSAPLVHAFYYHKSFTLHMAVDERSAGFKALGMAREFQLPVVIICTSGTAVVNLFPAVAEAYYQQIPILILSADRPPEMLNQQDGQMIMQKGIFGKHALASHELPCLDHGKEDFKLTEKIMIAALQQCKSSNGIGPVHVNVPLKEPLYSDNKPLNYVSVHEYKNEVKGNLLAIHTHDLKELIDSCENHEKILIIAGQNWVDAELSSILESLSNKQIVVLPDITSNQIAGFGINNFDAVLKYSNADLLQELQPDVIISFGGSMVSKSLRNWLKEVTPAAHFRIDSRPHQINTYGNVTHFIQASVTIVLERLAKSIKQEKNNSYRLLWKNLAQKATNTQQAFLKGNIWCEPKAVSLINNLLSKDFILHVGNSSIIRFVSWLANDKINCAVYGNRGTSGIEGILSTAVGAALVQPNKTHLVLLGDLSFWYDQNALWPNNIPNNLKIILFNNSGGGIFNWIDGPSKDNNVINFFNTPLARNAEHLSKELNLNYLSAKNLDELSAHLNNFLSKTTCTVFELFFEPNTNTKYIKQFIHLKI